MDFFSNPIEFVLNLDEHLREAIQAYGPWVYGLLFLIVFCETGLVVTPFLPGDTLLFAAGIFSHPEQGMLNFWLMYLVFMGAALAGDNVNYQIGRLLGRRLFHSEESRVFKRSHLDRTHAFFERHGGKTIIIARFVPILRTFTPFVAGMGAMTYAKFLVYSVFAAWFWVAVCMGAGYLFGSIPQVRENFALAILGLVAFSMIPYGIEGTRMWMRRRKRLAVEAAELEGAPK
jgi:membrane-associated protein